MTSEERKDRIAALRKTIEDARCELHKLEDGCDHIIVESEWESALCTVCNKHFGWYCPDAPDHICDYLHDDGHYDDDDCKYCGQPDERK